MSLVDGGYYKNVYYIVAVVYQYIYKQHKTDMPLKYRFNEVDDAKDKESGQLDERTWRFFEENIRIHETDSLYSRVRIPHAKVSLYAGPIRCTSWGY